MCIAVFTELCRKKMWLSLFLFEVYGHVIANLNNLFGGIVRQGGLG